MSHRFASRKVALRLGHARFLSVFTWSKSQEANLAMILMGGGKRNKSKEDLARLTELLEKFAPKEDTKASAPQHKANPGNNDSFQVLCRQCFSAQVLAGHF